MNFDCNGVSTTARALSLLGAAALCVACAGAAGAATWPDGSPMDAWFADRSPVDEAGLGPLRRAQEFGAKPDTKQLYEHILVENATGRSRYVFFMLPWTQWFTLPEGVGKQETRVRNVEFRNCRVHGVNKVKIDKSWMFLEGFRFDNKQGTEKSVK